MCSIEHLPWLIWLKQGGPETMSLRRQLCLNTSLSRREALISQVTKTVGHLYHNHVVWTINCGTACGEFLFI